VFRVRNGKIQSQITATTTILKFYFATLFSMITADCYWGMPKQDFYGADAIPGTKPTQLKG